MCVMGESASVHECGESISMSAVRVSECLLSLSSSLSLWELSGHAACSFVYALAALPLLQLFLQQQLHTLLSTHMY